MGAHAKFAGCAGNGTQLSTLVANMQTSTIKIVFVVVFAFTLANQASGFLFGENGMLGKIKSGFETAGKMLGLDKASGVAQLVSEAFHKSNRKADKGDHGNAIFSAFLRVLGLDTRRIGAIAVNAIIFVAQLISTSLSKPPPAYLAQSRDIKDGSPLEWILSNPAIDTLLPLTREGNLPYQIIEYLQDNPARERTGCLQLLVCKGAPFIWGMQKAINAKGKDVKKGLSALTAYLPTREEVEENGDECEAKHPYCLLQY